MEVNGYTVVLRYARRVEPATGEEGVVAGEEYLEGDRCPAEHLVQPICEVDGSRASERV